MHNFEEKSLFLFPVLTAVLLSAGFSVPALRWLTCVSLIPLFFFIQKNYSGGKVFWGGLTTGFIFEGYLISYFFSAYPLDWAGITSEWGILAIFLCWLASSCIMALPFGIFALIAKPMFRRSGVLEVMGIACVWIICEYLKGWSLAALTIGPGSLLGPHYSIGDLGYAFDNSPRLLQLAGWGGVYLLSFFAVSLNVLIFGIIADLAKREKGSAIVHGLAFSRPVYYRACVLIILIICTLLLGRWQIKEKDIDDQNNDRVVEVALLQTAFPSDFWENPQGQSDRWKVYLALANKIRDRGEATQLVVIPERQSFLELSARVIPKIDIRQFFGEKSSPIIVDVGRSRRSDGNNAFIVFVDSRSGKIIGEQKKLMLMPTGEYLPHAVRLMSLIIGREAWNDEFLSVRGYKRGGELTVIDSGFGKAGALLCSEILSPVLYRSLTAKGAEILINSASDSVFRGNPLLLSQNLAMAKMRAVENNRYFLQATNFGFSYLIDNRGEIRSVGNKIGDDVIFGRAKIISNPSFYAEAGDWILILAAAFIIFHIWQSKKAADEDRGLKQRFGKRSVTI